MKIFKILGIIIISTVGLILLSIIIVNILGTRTDIVNGVNSDKIKKVKPGMTLEQVTSILGLPYKIDASQGLHNFDCKKPRHRLSIEINKLTDIKLIVDNFYNDTNYCCEGNKEDMQTKGVTMTYTRPVSFSKYYPMLWVHIDSNYRVYSIYAKRYEGFLGLDDLTIYSLSCDFDTLTSKLDYESTKEFINDKVFQDSFD